MYCADCGGKMYVHRTYNGKRVPQYTCGQYGKYPIRFHLDPRTKLLLLILFSVVVMINVTDGPAYIVRAIMTYIPVVLVCLEGKPHVGARFTVLFILATWLMEITQENIGGISACMSCGFDWILREGAFFKPVNSNFP